jgi:thiol:disulfide interchange protein DsbC
MSPLITAAALVALFPAAAAPGASVEESLAARFPGVEPEDVRPSAVPGLWEVAVGAQVVYLSEDGRYMVRGELVDLVSGQNLTDARLSELRLEVAGRLSRDFDERRMVVFSPDKPTHTVTIFTDVDCVHCRKLHGEIEEYNKLGIKVRYLFYPLAGVGSESWAKADAVWCSPNRNEALTRAKLGQSVKATQPCVNTPTAEHHRMATELGIRGTPAILTEQGDLLPGYVPAEQLAAWLNER